MLAIKISSLFYERMKALALNKAEIDST